MVKLNPIHVNAMFEIGQSYKIAYSGQAFFGLLGKLLVHQGRLTNQNVTLQYFARTSCTICIQCLLLEFFSTGRLGFGATSISETYGLLFLLACFRKKYDSFLSAQGAGGGENTPLIVLSYDNGEFLRAKLKSF